MRIKRTMTTAVAELPAELWMIVLEKVVEAHAAVVGTEAVPKVMMRRFLAKMAVSKLIMRLVRESEALGPIGRIRCTLEDVPTAIAMFKSLTVLWVMGDEQAPHAPAGPVVDAARRALERAGRFEELVRGAGARARLAAGVAGRLAADAVGSGGGDLQPAQEPGEGGSGGWRRPPAAHCVE